MIAAPRIPVIIVDPRILLAEGLARLLAPRCPRFEILPVTHYSKVFDLPFGDHSVAILLVGHGFLVSRRAVHEIVRKLSNARIILVDDHPRPGGMFTVVRTAVHGYWTLQDRLADMVAGIKTVLAGGVSVSPHGETYLVPGEKCLKYRENMSGTGLHMLSPRELECLIHLVHLRNLERCAEVMEIRRRTVENVKFRIMQKLKLHTWPDLIHFAYRHALVDHEAITFPEE